MPPDAREKIGRQLFAAERARLAVGGK